MVLCSSRVLFLECPDEVCRDRLVNRKMNMYSGSVVHILENPSRALDPNLATHPTDGESIVMDQVYFSYLLFYCVGSWQANISSFS